jgi:transposase
MSVYLVEATKASCRVSGCLCRDRGPRYPSDATDAEWELLRPEVQVVMAQLRRGPGGRPMEHDLRAVLDAIRYVNRYGIEWRALPVDFPPWEAVYAFFERWNARGLPQGLVDRLRGRLRVAHGRADLPTAGSIDSPSVKAADTVGATSRGFDSGKRINGRKRHLAVDTLGLVLTVVVTPPQSRIVMGRVGCWPCCASGSPRSPWSGPTADTPAAWCAGLTPCWP